MKRRSISIRAALLLLALGATSQPSRDDPPTYAAPRATAAVAIDGALDDAAWAGAPWTEDFIDIEGTAKPVPPMRTRAKLAWDDASLYVAAELTDPRVWATMTKRDQPLFKEQCFELFIDPEDDHRDYLEVQINPLNTVCDLVMNKPYRDKGKSDASVNLAGLRTAVRVADGAWTVEIAIPWAALKSIGRDGAAPHTGERWRVNLARMRRDAPDVADPAPRGAWVWSNQGAVNMHAPEHWGWVEFAAAPPAAKP